MTPFNHPRAPAERVVLCKAEAENPSKFLCSFPLTTAYHVVVKVCVVNLSPRSLPEGVRRDLAGVDYALTKFLIVYAQVLRSFFDRVPRLPPSLLLDRLLGFLLA